MTAPIELTRAEILARQERHLGSRRVWFDVPNPVYEQMVAVAESHGQSLAQAICEIAEMWLNVEDELSA